MGYGGREVLKRSRVRLLDKKSNPRNLRKFLSEFQRTGVIRWACKYAGFSSTALGYYIEKSKAGDPELVIEWDGVEGPLHELFKIAETNVVKHIEGCAVHRATGYREVLTHQGHITYEIDWDKVNLEGATPGSPESFRLDERGRPIPASVEKQSEDLQMFILRARLPEVYGSKAQVDVTHRGGVLVVGARARDEKEQEAAERAFLTRQAPIDVEFREVSSDDDSRK